MDIEDQGQGKNTRKNKASFQANVGHLLKMRINTQLLQYLLYVYFVLHNPVQPLSQIVSPSKAKNKRRVIVATPSQHNETLHDGVKSSKNNRKDRKAPSANKPDVQLQSKASNSNIKPAKKASKQLHSPKNSEAAQRVIHLNKCTNYLSIRTSNIIKHFT